ncbi:hypothetical protein [Parasutterella sp.]|uniref:hypothetical protein n=1 Tax=Parasutterella sp. TaxID=2049037 RepID=UPI0030806077
MPKTNQSQPATINPFFVLARQADLSNDRFQQQALDELDELEKQTATVFKLAIQPLQEEIANSTTGEIPLSTAVQMSDLLSFTDSILTYLAEVRPFVKQEIK